jgi:hypothetical protein
MATREYMVMYNGRRLARYQEGRAKLIVELGGKCAICGGCERLEFDHYPVAATWVNRDVAPWVRLGRWRGEAARGLLRLLCRRCNSRYRPGLAGTVAQVQTSLGL